MEIEKENPTLSIIVTVPESESESATVQSEIIFPYPNKPSLIFCPNPTFPFFTCELKPSVNYL
ncbi:unnamed protein product [Brassica oleracea]